jgi:hypothetical protein
VARFSSSVFGILALCAVPTIATAQAGAKAAVTLDEATLAGEVKTDQRVMIAPESGKQFVWVKATLAGVPQTIDLTKVAIAGASASYPLVGVDSVFGGDPSQFSMISAVKLKTGKAGDPLEETLTPSRCRRSPPSRKRLAACLKVFGRHVFPAALQGSSHPGGPGIVRV